MRHTFICLILLVWGDVSPAAVGETEFVEDFVFQASDGSILIEDGDSFWMGNHKVRLYGVDTVEVGQPCLDGVRTIDCHAETMSYIQPLLSDPELICRPIRGKFGRPQISDGRYVSICYIGDEELNRRIVRDGWAVHYERIGGTYYEADEAFARASQAGLHKYEFDRPIDFRRDPPEVCFPATEAEN